MNQSWLFSRILQSYADNQFPRARKWLWSKVYDVLSLGFRDRDWRFMNYGFIPPGEPYPLRPEDEPERAFMGLYIQALEGLPVAGARVLEVGCGRGGGVRYVARYLDPVAVVGLDYSAQTVHRARALNSDVARLTFEQGDAERLPFADQSFDIVVNIESSHCYGNVEAFAREVARVLRPGGWFTFADLRPPAMMPELDRWLAAPGMVLVESRNLAPGVIAALDATDARKRERIGKLSLMRPFMSEFAGTRGSTIYQGLVHGHAVYVARRLQKAG
jgi:SAM-dependent methyltransferase